MRTRPALPNDPPAGRAPDLSPDEVAAILEACGVGPVERVLSVTREDRLYSTLWSASVRHPGNSASYLLKRADGPTDKAVRLSQRADRLMADDPLHVPLGLRRHAPTGLIVARRFEGRSLGDLLAEATRRNPFRWRREMETALALTGRWLAAYHRHERRRGSISEPLRRYVAGRQAEFDALPAPVREPFARLLAEEIVDDLVVTHSDFSPGNILTDGARVCVIDFGVREWTELSPWWDVATLEVILERFFRFDRATSGFWLAPFFPRLRDAFLEGYGAPSAPSRARSVCAAVRHLSLAGSAGTGTFGREARSRWHLSRWAEVLSAA